MKPDDMKTPPVNSNDSAPGGDEVDAAALQNGGAASVATQSGRFGFAVQMSPNGLMLRLVFVSQDGQHHPADAAVFPTLGYALGQLDELRALVLGQYDAAARAGALVLAQEQASKAAQQTGALQ